MKRANVVVIALLVLTLGSCVTTGLSAGDSAEADMAYRISLAHVFADYGFMAADPVRYAVYFSMEDPDGFSLYSYEYDDEGHLSRYVYDWLHIEDDGTFSFEFTSDSDTIVYEDTRILSMEETVTAQTRWLIEYQGKQVSGFVFEEYDEGAWSLVSKGTFDLVNLSDDNLPRTLRIGGFDDFTESYSYRFTEGGMLHSVFLQTEPATYPDELYVFGYDELGRQSMIIYINEGGEILGGFIYWYDEMPRGIPFNDALRSMLVSGVARFTTFVSEIDPEREYKEVAGE